MIEKFNPQDSPAVTFSDAAIQHFRDYLKQQGGIGVRISVKKTGCSGLAYCIESVENKLTNHLKITHKGVVFFIDNAVLPYLNGLHIDYVKKPLGLSELLYNNPNELARCGCGESFTVNDSDVDE